MANGIKKLQKVQLGMESVAGTAVSPTTLYRGTGGVLDDQRTLNKVEESVGLLSDTLRTNISKVLGMISLPSSNATFEQIQHFLVMAFGGPTLAASDGSAGSGAILTPVMSAGAITSVTVTNGGSGYTPASPRLLTYGGGQPPTYGYLTPTMSSGSISSVSVGGGGPTYTGTPSILVFPGATTGTVFQTPLPTTTLPTAKPYTITGGDNFETEQMEYGLCTKIEFSGESGGEVKVSADIMGRQVQYLNNTANPTLLTPTPVEDILFQLCKVYLDNVNGTFGTTQVSNAVEGFKLTLEIKWKPEFTADGVLYYTIASFTGWNVKGELTYIHNTPVGGVSGAKASFRNQTAKLLRLDFGGSAISVPGTAYTNKHLIFDVPMKFDKPGMLDNKDGTSTVTMSFAGGYDFTAGNAGKVIVVTDGQYVLPVYS